MRLGMGIALIWIGAASLLVETPVPIGVVQSVLGAVAGVGLLVGLWTPATGALAALDQLWIAFSAVSPNPAAKWIHVLFAVLCAGVAMLGPGVWSIDARLFGRRRFPTRRA